MRNFTTFLILIISATTVCAYYIPSESVSDDTGDLSDVEIDPEDQLGDDDQLLLVRNKRARFDSFYGGGSALESGESGGQLYYQPLFRYRQTKKKRRRLFVPNLWG
ncbi:hypothetical protein DMENIID0001_109330 [Sergentomyia squamirostris]